MQEKRTDKLPRRERERLAHRQEILAAAEKVFGEKGLHKATVEEIARQSEFSVGALYNFFANKEKLCAELLRKIAADFGAAFSKQVQAEKDPLAAIENLVLLRIRYVQEHGAFFRLFLEARPMARVIPDSAIPDECKDLYDKYLNQVAVLFKKAMSSGSLRKMDPFDAALCLEGVINAFTAFWERRRFSDSPETRTRKVCETFMQMLRSRECKVAPGSKAGRSRI